MKYKVKEKVDHSKDIIIPFRKSELQSEKIADFDGEFGSYQLLYSNEGSRIYLLGLGEDKHTNRLQEVFRKLVFKEKDKWKGDVQIDCSKLEDKEIMAAAIGMEMAMYKIGQQKTKKEDKIKFDFIFLAQKSTKAAVEEGKATGETINSIKALVDAPPNVKTPAYLGQWAEASANKYEYQCKLWDDKALKKDGFEAILAVGRGSQHESRLIKCSYLPKPDADIDIVLVGKGITFDTGGISIKGSTNLHYMKSDMGGAAAVLGAVELTARLGLQVNVVGLVGSAENAVDGRSYLPGDVIKSYSGKTIEIINTDAEGRLALADGLNYAAKKLKPEVLLDMATLTGSAVRTLGYSAAAMFTNSEALALRLTNIGESIYERVWRLPMYEEMEEELHSDVADVKNLSEKPVAGASIAAKFLEYFTEEHPGWVHLDIAGVAFGSNEYAKMKSASGYGVRLAVEFIKTLQS
ncbi:leucyl aminopeptidase family protein [Portibacter marinus]|uniref:leucyl aminopeptidase family protein n=1 Tax=Portibacter marinus TaxID=2898660 RepID=UPI001F1B2784|nr:leucyl aminopeptidase family protein [Portibacter marinus]